METRGQVPGFAPVWAAGSRALILGSYPSPKSFDMGFYYGNPRNRFWPVIASLAGRPVPTATDEKRALILESGLALWDVLERCAINGASDASITDPVPNDIAALVRHTAIRAVFCNGDAAYTLYRRLCAEKTGIAASRLPSTSPANAACTLPRLLAAWQPVAAFMGR